MEQVQELRKLLLPYRYVGFLCYDDFALQTHKLAGGSVGLPYVLQGEG